MNPLAKYGVTEREWDVVEMFMQTGQSDSRTAKQLGMQTRTAKAHMERVYLRMQIQGPRKRITLFYKVQELVCGLDGSNESIRTLEGFTPTERKILKMVSIGMTNDEIAREHGVSEGYLRTVAMTRLFDKSGMGNRMELALWFRQAVSNRKTTGVSDKLVLGISYQ